MYRLQGLIPGLKFNKEHFAEGKMANDVSFASRRVSIDYGSRMQTAADLFDLVDIDDPRVAGLCHKAGQHPPKRILQVQHDRQT